MKLTIKTTTLQTMMSKAMKGASGNKMIPLTSLMAIQLKDSKLTIITTDATNYLYVEQDKVVGEDFYIVIQTDVFSKLIARLTCETVALELKENMLLVKGNGSYSIELPLDEEGELIKYPDPRSKVTNVTETREVNLSTVKLILATAAPSLATTTDVPCYTGYYMGENIIATDTYKICAIDIKLWDEPALVSPDMINLLGIFTDEKIKVARNNTTMIFSTPNMTVYGTLMDNLADFQVELINQLISTSFVSSCKIAKSAIVQLLERLALFVSPYDKNGIYLTFTKDGLQVESRKANSVEVIPYKESHEFADYACCIDIEMLTDQIKANTSDSIEIHYGEDNAIKIADGNVTQIVALLEYDR